VLSLGRGRVLSERGPDADGARQKLAFAVWARALQVLDRTIFAKRAFERTDHRAGLVGGQIRVAALAIGAHLKHSQFSSGIRAA
jgi:hypothetical protein